MLYLQNTHKLVSIFFNQSPYQIFQILNKGFPLIFSNPFYGMLSKFPDHYDTKKGTHVWMCALCSFLSGCNPNQIGITSQTIRTCG